MAIQLSTGRDPASFFFSLAATLALFFVAMLVHPFTGKNGRSYRRPNVLVWVAVGVATAAIACMGVLTLTIPFRFMGLLILNAAACLVLSAILACQALRWMSPSP